jgi:LPXTG-motif cell wall-anchored protein
MPRLIPTAFAVALLALVPAAAHAQPASPPAAHAAQGAGDDQYSDPFTGSDGGGSNQDSSGSGSSGDSEPPTSSSGSGSAPAPAVASAPSAPATSASGEAGELPHTGLDAGPLALTGGVLLLGGAALRRRVRA